MLFYSPIFDGQNPQILHSRMRHAPARVFQIEKRRSSFLCLIVKKQGTRAEKSGMGRKPHLHRKERWAVGPCSGSDPRLRVALAEKAPRKKQARHSRHCLLRLSTLFHAEEGSFRFLANKHPDDCLCLDPKEETFGVVPQKLGITPKNRLCFLRNGSDRPSG
jgi:hypothetical protein